MKGRPFLLESPSPATKKSQRTMNEAEGPHPHTKTDGPNNDNSGTTPEPDGEVASGEGIVVEIPGEDDAANSSSPDAEESNGSQSADANLRAGEEDGEETGEPGEGPGEPPLLRDWDSAPHSPPIDYSTLDETPYEHNFEPGDHVIRWDMLPILWPIQIHGIVLEVSEDKSEVTICDFGITSVKSDDEEKKIMGSMEEKIVEEENAKFNEAIQDEVTVQSESTDGESSSTKKEPSKKKNQRLNVIKLTKWSDLRKWHKVNYEGGLLSASGKGGVGKGLKKLGEHSKRLGQKTEKLWSSMTKSINDFVNDNGTKNAKDKKKVWRSVRYDVDENGFCEHHPDIQLQRRRDDGDWAVVRKKCPECIKEDCPAMLGEDGLELANSFSSTEGQDSVSQVGAANPTATSETTDEGSSKVESTGSEESAPPSSVEESQSAGTADDDVPPTSESTPDCEKTSNSNVSADTADIVGKEDAEPKSLAEMIAEANEIEKRRPRKTVVKTGPPSPDSKASNEKLKSWHGSFMKSMKSMKLFPQKTEKEASMKEESPDDQKEAAVEEEQAVDPDKKPNTPEGLPRSDPPILVLARTRFILEHGENILPPYHIINSNSECIAVWCKTGRWSTLQASVFLHSTAIGHAKSATALTIGVAATQPWLIPAFATVGLAAVGTPWLFLKVANDKWNEATLSLNEKFWMQAEPEVFVECIEKWSRIQQ